MIMMVDEGVQGVGYLHGEWDIRVGSDGAFSAIEKLYVTVLHSRLSH